MIRTVFEPIPVFRKLLGDAKQYGRFESITFEQTAEISKSKRVRVLPLQRGTLLDVAGALSGLVLLVNKSGNVEIFSLHLLVS